MRRILIVDSNSVLAMRVKVLLELIGCRVELLHFAMVDDAVLEQAVFTHHDEQDGDDDESFVL